MSATSDLTEPAGARSNPRNQRSFRSDKVLTGQRLDISVPRPTSQSSQRHADQLPLVGLNTQPRGRPAVGELMRSPRRLDGPATDTLPATLGARRPHRLLVRRPTHHLAVRM